MFLLTRCHWTDSVFTLRVRLNMHLVCSDMYGEKKSVLTSSVPDFNFYRFSSKLSTGNSKNCTHKQKKPSEQLYITTLNIAQMCTKVIFQVIDTRQYPDSMLLWITLRKSCKASGMSEAGRVCSKLCP